MLHPISELEARFPGIDPMIGIAIGILGKDGADPAHDSTGLA